MRIERALLSVSDKRGIVEFAKGLAELKVRLISTGGTAKLLQEASLQVTEVSELTGFPEMLGGRVKTLHPAIHGGILARRDDPSHQKELQKHQITPIDLVVVNLYPFETTIATEGCTLEKAIEQIDIGGPALIRSAAKNFEAVGVIVDPEDYPKVLEELRHQGHLSRETRLQLAEKAFAHTARYEALITSYLEEVRGKELGGRSEILPRILILSLEKAQELRYGENPHQRAAFYRAGGWGRVGGWIKQIQGKELSYNNLLDLDAAWRLCQEFEGPAAAIVKHGNPCGVVIHERLFEAYRRARATDPVSAYGGVVGFNRPLDQETAQEIAQAFVEAIAAPGYEEEALAILCTKKNLRLIEVRRQGGLEIQRAMGGFLIQEPDTVDVIPEKLQVVTKRAPTEEEMRALRFAWRVAKHVKSNAIVLAEGEATVGIGAGQMSRVDSVKLAIMKANFPTQGTVLASDGFFPFRDGVDVAAEAGIAAIIQPGGSIRDEEVIRAADEHGMAMVFTGIRHFRH
ncbi:MAG: bifunctional phosphoribosylaminoimidazolecarboxamide formyltransferase/IMP cyclohydrolase [Candidatus Methylomirabilales bacterium]